MSHQEIRVTNEPAIMGANGSPLIDIESVMTITVMTEIETEVGDGTEVGMTTVAEETMTIKEVGIITDKEGMMRKAEIGTMVTVDMETEIEDLATEVVEIINEIEIIETTEEAIGMIGIVMLLNWERIMVPVNLAVNAARTFPNCRHSKVKLQSGSLSLCNSKTCQNGASGPAQKKRNGWWPA